MIALLWYIIAVVLGCFVTPYIAGVFHASGIYEIGVLLIVVFVINMLLGYIPLRFANPPPATP